MKPSYMENRIVPILHLLQEQSSLETLDIPEFFMKACGYHSWNTVHEDATQWEGRYVQGQTWGGVDYHCCFKQHVKLPASYTGKPVYCRVRTGKTDIWNYDNPQFLAFVNGKLVCGLDVNHTEFRLFESAPAEETVELAFYAYCSTKKNDLFLDVSLCLRNEEARGLYFDLAMPYESLKLLSMEEPEYHRLSNTLHEALSLLDLRLPGSASFLESVRTARAYLSREVYGEAQFELDQSTPSGQAPYSLPHRPGEAVQHCIGHTHIDIAWLWTVAQTREKVLRSFSTALHLMELYPDYKFMSSQPQLYAFVKRDYPELYAQIKARVAEGRWEIEGGMWLESDCTLTSGESLVRHILYGKQFIREEFGRDSKVLWLPDVFGYSAALPQIMRKSGLDYFMTTKINWNDTNALPHDTLMWQGIDGTEVLSYFISTKDYDVRGEQNPNPSFATTYNGTLNPNQVKGGWQRYQDKALNTEILQCYGNGDGGGGPTAEMLENARRLQTGLPGVPRVEHTFVLDFFRGLEERVKNSPLLPRWVGELYLEYHRGTYTSMARNKRWNRKSELLLGDAELLSVLGALYFPASPYPYDMLRQAWDKVLLNQFHDILPGTAIKEVYDVTDKEYEEVQQTASTVIDQAWSLFCDREDAEHVTVFNTLSWQRDELASLPGVPANTVVYDGKTRLPSYVDADGVLHFLAAGLPAKGGRSYQLGSAEAAPATSGLLTQNGNTYETPFYRITLDEEGYFRSIMDLEAGRELVHEGARANELQVFTDRPREYDAWNIDAHYEEQMWAMGGLIECTVVENNSLFAILRQKRQFLSSTVEQDIVFYRHTRRIDFRSIVDWKESSLLLKAAFPTTIQSAKAVYDIQFGNVERPTHRNTSWDEARFEVSAQKWADLAEYGYGVSLMNDCKYGYDIYGSQIRLTLLKSATYPNADADKEVHHFTYSLYPHEGDFRTGRVIPEAHALNSPVYTLPGALRQGMDAAFSGLVSCTEENLVVETIKQAESGKGIIIRLHEAYGKRTQAHIRLNIPGLNRLEECDLMENPLHPLALENGSAVVEIKPYEIKTLRATSG